MKSYLPCIGVLLGLPSCTLDVTCPAEVNAGIVVEVREASNGTPAALGTRGAAKKGQVVDSLFLIDQLRLEGAFAPGTYSVALEKPGFQPWQASAIIVEWGSGACPLLKTVRLQADLVVD